MIAKLFIHPTLETRLQAMNQALKQQDLKKDHPDVLWLEEEKLGVEQAKKIRQHLSLKPYSAKGRVVVVENAHNLTVDAQNSLLKTLEEPPAEAIILLTAGSDKNILPTVLSRVQTVILSEAKDLYSSATPQNDTAADIQKLLDLSVEQRFDYIEKLEDREQFLTALVVYFHHQLPKHPEYLNFSQELLKAEEWKQANGNIRAILEYLMLRLPKGDTI